MKYQLIKNNGNPRLILIFAGWGMDANPFSDIDINGYDIAVAYDYSSEDFDSSCLGHYREIVLLAWSMGVFEASRILAPLSLPISLKIAINGTMTPVNDLTGIPVNIFNATLETLSPASLAKFNRRMCGSANTLDEFNSHPPRRSIQSLRTELLAIGQRASAPPCSQFQWDIAVVADHDMIFPAKAQLAAWQGTPTLEISGAHIVNFAEIINRLVVDKDKVAHRFAASRTTYDAEATLQHNVAQRLAENLNNILSGLNHSLKFDTAIEIGAGSGTLTDIYTQHMEFNDLQLWDIAPVTIDSIPTSARVIIDDAEARLKATPSASIDLVISASTLQWFNSPAAALAEINRILRPGGIAAITFYVEGTYQSLAQTIGTSLNYITPRRAIQSIDQSQSTILMTRNECDTIKFRSTRQLLDHLRYTGVNAVGHSSPAAIRRALRENQLTNLEYNTLHIIFTKK